MTAINKSTLPSIRAEINAALAAVGSKHGLVLSIGNIRFTADSFRTTLEAKTFSQAGREVAAIAVEQIDLESAGQRVLGTGVDLTKEYMSPTLGKVKLIGYHPRKPKYPFIVQTTAGKRFKITVASARNLVGA
jgi:hypothetical protein